MMENGSGMYSGLLRGCKYKQISENSRKIEGVKRAFGVHGRWDIVAEIEAADLKALGEAVLKIHGMEGVRATETLVGF